jgi:hypothetical protein
LEFRQVLLHPADPPTTTSLMGYQVVVKPGEVPKNIVMKRLNAHRDIAITESGNRRSQRYFDEILPTYSGKLRKA